MTGNTIAKRVRLILNDFDRPYEWKSTTLVEWINEGVALIGNIRSDALLHTDGTILTITDIDALGGTITIADRWALPLTDYVVARCLDHDAGAKKNRDRSKHHFNRFFELLKVA